MTKKGVEDQKKTSPHDDSLIQQIAVRSATSFCKKIRTTLFLKGTVFHCITIIRHLVHEFDQKRLNLQKNLA